jgi:hypothetical protein
MSSIALVVGCGLTGVFLDDCSAPDVGPPAEPLPPLRLALRYLNETQLKMDRWNNNQVDYAGDWPQCFTLAGRQRWVRDASPFMSTFVHQALALFTASNQQVLDLTEADVADARRMRRAAVDLMLRFQAKPPCPDAGTFAFWPHHRDRWLPGDLVLKAIAVEWGRGPQLMGNRAPINVSFFPEVFAIPADADDTATIYSALLDHALLDGGSPVETGFTRFFADWRDLGQVPRRNDASWLPASSGAFLTWLAYHDEATSPRSNDVDIIVNANVLYALGRFQELDTPGVTAATRLINDAVAAGAHLESPGQLSLYYPDNLALHYSVVRAFAAGGVSDLEPAARALMGDLLSSAERSTDGPCFWDRGDPHLNTAFGTLALIFMESDDPVVDGAVAYLLSEQDQRNGQWRAGSFFRGRFDTGIEAVWISPALTTAVAMEAIARYKLQSGGSGYFPKSR